MMVRMGITSLPIAHNPIWSPVNCERRVLIAKVIGCIFKAEAHAVVGHVYLNNLDSQYPRELFWRQSGQAPYSQRSNIRQILPVTYRRRQSETSLDKPLGIIRTVLSLHVGANCGDSFGEEGCAMLH